MKNSNQQDSFDELRVLLIYGRTNRHLGLWDDLKDDHRVVLRSAELKKDLSTVYKYLFRFVRMLEKLKVRTHVYHKFYQYSDIFDIIPKVKHLLIIDGALNTILINDLIKCKQINPQLQVSLYLLNSIAAKSPVMNGVRPKMKQYEWDNIYTFDNCDAKKHGFKYLGFCYYSNHAISNQKTSSSEVFFTGGLKGGREQMIYDVYTFFKCQNIKCDFFLMPFRNTDVKLIEGPTYYYGWKPYQEILEHVSNSNCILEIVQDGQHGASLRYFEAVTMNKKLLTNNNSIVDFPFYNPRWMKIFKTIEDIDIKWIKEIDDVNYGYNNEFSPKNLISKLH